MMRGPLVAIAFVVACLCCGPGCGRRLIGFAPGAIDAGVDGKPGKPPAVTAWEPKSADPHAHITVTRVADQFTYVGFSDGEIYYRATAGGTSWTRMDLSDNVGGQLTPRMAVTAIAIDTLESSPGIFVGYAGETGAHSFWCAVNKGPSWLERPLTDDVWAISISPFDSSAIVIVTPSQTWTGAGCASTLSQSVPGTFGINFPGAVQSFAEGRAADGSRRAWVGDSMGGVYYADDIDATAPAAAVWTAARSTGMPSQPVIAISVNRDHPEQVWVTFKGLSATAIWATTDNGSTWTNQWRPDLVMTAAPSSMSSLNAVSLVAELDLAYVSALMPDPAGAATKVLSFWTVGRAQPWSLE